MIRSICRLPAEDYLTREVVERHAREGHHDERGKEVDVR